MKLVPKLTLALVTAMCVVLAVNAYLRVKREVGYVQADRVRDHEMVGRALGAAVSAMWRSEGRSAAVAVIDAAESHFSKIDIAWVDAPRAAETCSDVWASAEPFTAARSGVPLTNVRSLEVDNRLHTCVPIDVAGERKGVVELREPMPHETSPIGRVVKDAALTAIAIVSVSALLALLLGVWLVGRPVGVLTDKARRIARGDFAGPIALSQADEFSILARELNAMCVRLTSTLDQLRHADRLTTVGKLASGIAHELGTPLNIISARATMIASGETTSAETADYARVIGSAAQRMTKIIQQLLEFARKRGAQKAEQKILPLVEEAVELLRPLAKKREVQLVVGADKTRPLLASVDSAQFEQVVTNLVINSMQAMPRGGEVRVHVGREKATRPQQLDDVLHEFVVVSVQDEGEGIAPEHLPHIFEPFYTTKDVGEGTGLGLSVSYGIIEDHGGWITVDSEVGRGSKFDIYLPVEVAT